MGEQTAIGFFKRWVRGTALCRIPFYDNFRKLFNILETIEGRNGIKILKPTGNDGFGWTITKDYDKSDLPAGDSTNVALKWSEADLSWKAVLPVDVANDEQSGALGEDDRVVTGIKTGSDGKLLQLITKPLGPSGVIPDISVASPADGGTASGTFDVLTGLAVDGTDKHKLNPTKKSVTLPTVSGYTGTLTVVVGWETVADGTTDRMKMKTREFTFASGLLSSIGAEVSTQWFVATPHVDEHPGGL